MKQRMLLMVITTMVIGAPCGRSWAEGHRKGSPFDHKEIMLNWSRGTGEGAPTGIYIFMKGGGNILIASSGGKPPFILLEQTLVRHRAGQLQFNLGPAVCFGTKGVEQAGLYGSISAPLGTGQFSAPLYLIKSSSGKVALSTTYARLMWSVDHRFTFGVFATGRWSSDTSASNMAIGPVAQYQLTQHIRIRGRVGRGIVGANRGLWHTRLEVGISF